MEAVRFHGLCNVKHDTGVTRPSPKAGQVGIQVRRVGICGSDVHVWKQDYGSELPYPLICGHEGAGIITELGEGVSGFQVGDRVCMEPTPPQAFDMVAEFYCHPAAKTFKLPDDISLDEGAMAEPWAVAVHAVKRAGVEKGDNVLVLGAGPVGQLSMVAAKVFGAARTVVTDIKPARLKTVELFGADAMVLVDGLSPAEAAAKAKEQFQNGEIDVVIDGVGGEASLATACAAVKTRGTVLIVGVATPFPKIPYGELLMRELTVKGSIYYGEDYPEALGLITSKKVDLKPMISHYITMEQAPEAFQWCADGLDDKGRAVTKVMFKIGD